VPKPYYGPEDGITIYHGDCREILPSLPRVDLVLTDPPYGAGYAGNPIRGKNRRSAPHPPQGWDSKCFENIEAVVRAGEVSVIWGGNYYTLPPSRCWFVWYKPGALPSMADCELAWVSKDGNAQHFSWSTAATNAERLGHCTQKPEALMSWCISRFPEARTVLDPFMGSGTTLRAAKDRGLTAIGIEICEEYCEIAAKRLSQRVLDFGTCETLYTAKVAAEGSQSDMLIEVPDSAQRPAISKSDGVTRGGA
jgi:site-specific DNA-methyltransferase (adenine-specific)/modification methylase